MKEQGKREAAQEERPERSGAMGEKRGHGEGGSGSGAVRSDFSLLLCHFAALLCRFALLLGRSVPLLDGFSSLQHHFSSLRGLLSLIFVLPPLFRVRLLHIIRIAPVITLACFVRIRQQ
ncbi:MAG: hypothetical protein WGN25_07670 [Candidatus Electrothrix sp. GW3-4]|uniref:hypothetical protein n=1 Tax=Candidatus Electrothrix sp. GW3-4 TaxID=3126740 RepID=UPI0030D077C8